MFDGEVVKEVGYKISLSAIFLTSLFLGLIVFYIIGYNFLTSLLFSLLVAFLIYITSKKSLERQKKD